MGQHYLSSSSGRQALRGLGAIPVVPAPVGRPLKSYSGMAAFQKASAPRSAAHWEHVVGTWYSLWITQGGKPSFGCGTASRDIKHGTPKDLRKGQQAWSVDDEGIPAGPNRKVMAL